MTNRTKLGVGVVVALCMGFLVSWASIARATSTRSRERARIDSRLLELERADVGFGRGAGAAPVPEEPAVRQDARVREERVAALEAAVEAPLHPRAPRFAKMSGGVRDPAEVEHTAGAGAEATRARLEEFTIERLCGELKLLARIADERYRSGQPVDLGPLLSACDILLARPLDDDQRAEALIHRGIGYQSAQDAPRAVADYSEAFRAAGPSSSLGRAAATKLAWTVNDPRERADWLLKIAAQRDAPAWERARAQCTAAAFLATADDIERAREEFRSIIRQYSDSDAGRIRDIVEEARGCLVDLDRGWSKRGER